MRTCKQCGLSIGDTATFCPVCGALADPDPVRPEAVLQPVAPRPAAPMPEPKAPAPEPTAPASEQPLDLATKARACEKADPARAATLYRQAIVERLDSSDDLLTDRSLRRDVQHHFDRLSLVLKREGRLEEALEEIDAAAYLGLVDDDTGTKAQRDALVKRRDALRRALAEG